VESVPTFVADELSRDERVLIYAPYRPGGEAITAVVAGEISISSLWRLR
jgi:hypothetical protein